MPAHFAFGAAEALATGVGAVFCIKGYSDDGPIALVFAALILGVVFLWAFGAAFRVPTSYVAVDASKELTRIRFAPFVDTVVSNRNIVGARVVHRNILGGVGVRTNFSGDVALVSTWGDVAEITFREPVRVWLIPKLIPLKAQRLALSVRNPQKLVERFGPPPAGPSRAPAAARKMNRRGS